MTSAEWMQSPAGRMDLDKPLYTLSIAAEILEIHPRTLMMYEALKLVIPQRTSTNRRLPRGHGLNRNGARLVIECLRLLDEHQIPRPKELREVNIEHVRI